ncbi:T9SS type A sorting domain-containing protein [Hymenobacter psychrophilus]|uniref:Por secretion system C-terminal sorting domain-containing protein n=1 Tax=Hymenobacter psychrophilus TaxID=651662 RepID=A0A1H3BHU1_9BACT|nr:T9SS type A sorting domain-containing protein [Hymenobacter psychrophilus]SDX41542.1 Por secretion system C-terminal sorting domain-containing protein [Hymenobacter psychrophilus]
MKKQFTLAALGLLTAGAFSAQAQVTVDGQLTAAELTAGNYILLGKSNSFTGNQNDGRPFGKAGLLSLYVANTPTKVYMFLGGTVEAGGNSFQIYLDLPGATGVPAATFLPAGAAGTSFEKVTRIKLDQAADLALALRSDGAAVGGVQNYKVEAAVYSSATAVQSKQLTDATTLIKGDGTALTIPATLAAAPYAGLAGSRMAYRNTSNGEIGTNPGNTNPITGATYGAAGSFGWEIEIDRAALGATTGTPTFRIFAIQNNGSGGFASGEFIPQATGALPTGLQNPNLGGADANSGAGNDVDFAAIPGTQSAGFILGTSGTVLGNRSAIASALKFGVYPNPAPGAAKISYVVPGQQEVSVDVFNSLGQRVRSVASGRQTGSQEFPLSDLASGAYFVKLQVGGQSTSQKLIVQ